MDIKTTAIRLINLLTLLTLLSGCATAPRNEQISASGPSSETPTEVAPLTIERVPAPPTQLGREAAETVQRVEPPRAELYPGSGVFLNPRALSSVRKPGGDPGDITLNFEGADIREVVATIIGDILGENYLIDPEVKGAVTLQTSRPVDRREVMGILESLLKANNAALIYDDSLYRIVTKTKITADTLASPLSFGPYRSGYQHRVIPLKHIAAKEMAKILEPVARKQGILKVDADRNLLIVAGTETEIAHMQELVELFDVDWLRGMSVGLITIRYANIKSIVEELEAIFGDTAEGPLAGMLRLLPIERLNALLVITPKSRYLQEARTWVNRLDRPTGGEGRRLYVYRVQNGRAEDLASVLNELFTGKQPERSAPGEAELAPGLKPLESESPPAPGTPPIAKRPSSPPLPSASSSGTGIESLADVTEVGEVGIIAEQANNALIILATPTDYAKIENAIRQLDLPPLQVLVEVSIVDVTLSGDLSYGIQWFFSNKVGDSTGSGVVGAPLAFSPTFSYTLTSAAGDIQALLRVLASEDKVRVISAPYLMVQDNQTASIRVGDQQPVSTSFFSSNGQLLSQSVQFKDTGVTLNVTPRVNAGGLVTMDITQDVTDVGEIDEATNQRSFLQRTISSSVAVNSGETVVLGGLIKNSDRRAKTGVPFLYNLPVIGWLFGQTITENDRTELIALITPHAVRNEHEARDITAEFKSRLTNLGTASGLPKGWTTDYATPEKITKPGKPTKPTP